MNYIWTPCARDLKRIHMLVESGYGDVDIADDMGVDPIDIERLRPTLDGKKTAWNAASPSDRLNMLAGVNTKEYIKLEEFAWSELPLEIRFSLIA